MKYLIKESQIKKFIWDYFDSEDYDIAEDDNDIFLLDDYGNFDWNYTCSVSVSVFLFFLFPFFVYFFSSCDSNLP
jgi:hypothetical protein